MAVRRLEVAALGRQRPFLTALAVMDRDQMVCWQRRWAAWTIRQHQSLEDWIYYSR